MIYVFDLDETLYDEWTFIDNALLDAASFIHEKLGLPKKKSQQELVRLVRLDRKRVFDRFFENHAIHSKRLVRQCLSVYRNHIPHIKLYPDAKRCLARFPDSYLVTDGNWRVQKNKAEALELPSLMKCCLYTHAYGLIHAKPSPYCFYKICKWEGVSPSEVVYIADNPQKDFLIKREGFITVRVMRGQYAQVNVPKKYDAQIKISSLDELTERRIAEWLK